jgi:glycosyltransferase involved in cell wall biosynthesis
MGMTAKHSRLPRISVVVPSYNQGHFLPEAFESIFRQEYPDLEVVVMDGGSTDESVSIIKSYAQRIKYWQTQKDGGQSAAINSGMGHCTGELVAWLNSDDFYWGNALWVAGQAYAAYPEQGLYLGNGLRFEQSTGTYTPFCSRHVVLNRAALLEGTDYLLQPSAFFLRQAWEKVGGLDLRLSFCMDWDIFIRISQLYPAVTIQELLGVSREYDETKTRSGKMKRAAEIVRMVQFHTRTEVTLGSLLFLLETLVEVAEERGADELSHHFRAAQNVVARQISTKYGGGHGFPEQSDPQDSVYLPFAIRGADHLRRPLGSSPLPTISIITPSMNRCDDLQPTLDSIQNQQYERVESIVIDGAVSEASAINKGLILAQGEVLAWLNPGDLLAEGALQEVGRAFAEDPDVDLVYGNAVSIDAQGQLFLADQGSHRSGLWVGGLQKPKNFGRYGSEVYAVPQQTVFFRRRLLQQCGPVDESFCYIFDYELFTRFARHAKIKKIERIQALCRLRTGSRGRWNEILIELYRLSRARWPGVFSSKFPAALWEFVTGYMRRKLGGHPRELRSAVAVGLVALAAATRIGNPERWWKNRFPVPDQESPPLRLPPPRFRRARPFFASKAQDGIFHSLFCARQLKARDFQILGLLQNISTIGCLSQSADLPADLPSLLAQTMHTPSTVAAMWPDLIGAETLGARVRNRFAILLRRLGLPVPGCRNPLYVTEQLPSIYTKCRAAIQEALESNRFDFLFVSPQTNPLALTLKRKDFDTRFIWIVDQIETERLELLAHSCRGMTRLAHNWEAQRARKFERENLALYDGVIAADERDRQALTNDWGYPAERIRVLGETTDSGFGAWLAQLKSLPCYTSRAIVYSFKREPDTSATAPLAKGA